MSLLGHLCSFSAMWRNFLWCDCHFLRVTAMYELKCTRNATWLPQPSKGHFWSNDVTSGSLPATWVHLLSCDEISCHVKACCHVTRFPVTWRPLPVSYSHVGAETCQKHQFLAFHCLLKATSSEMTTSGHFQSLPAMWHLFLSRDWYFLRVTGM